MNYRFGWLASSLFASILGLSAAGSTQTADCTDAKLAVTSLQKKLAAAQENESSSLCSGSASVACLTTVNSIQSQLRIAGQLSTAACAPTSIKATYPTYIVVSIIYAPPGNQGSVMYEAGSSTGTSIESTSGDINGYQVQATSLVSNWQLQYTKEISVGTSTEIKKSTTYPIVLQSNQDELDHDQDQFYLWVNPQLDFHFVRQTLAGYSLAPQTGQDMNVIELNARELKNPSSISADKKTFLNKFKASDYAAILAKDPFLSASTPDPKRFYRIDTVEIWGPDAPGDDISGAGVHESSEISNGQIVETKETVQLAVLFGFTIENIGIMGGTVGGWDSDNKSELTRGTSQDITFIPLSNSIGYYKKYDVLFDSIFNSFAFVAKPEAAGTPTITGTVRNKVGGPAKGQVVTIRDSGGWPTRVLTDDKGHYRYSGASMTSRVVESGGVSKLVNPSATAVLVDFTVDIGRMPILKK